MSERLVHQCQCSICQAPATHPIKELHAQMNLYLSRLDEQQRRWYVEEARAWRNKGDVDCDGHACQYYPSWTTRTG